MGRSAHGLLGAVFAESYADQNERDYDALRRAVETGLIKAETGI